jgi:hypothetical protein
MSPFSRRTQELDALPYKENIKVEDSGYNLHKEAAVLDFRFHDPRRPNPFICIFDACRRTLLMSEANNPITA